MNSIMFRRSKGKFALLLAILMILSLIPAISVNAETTNDGYTIISTANELDTVVRNNLSGKYRLGNDIDLSGYSYNSSTWTSSLGWRGIGTTQALAFKGTLDGDGYTISGLWSYARGSNQGLFGWLSGATIKNLTIELSSKGITGGGERVGALAGNAYNTSTIENVHVVGENGSSIKGSANYVAGLVGVVYKSSVTDSSVTNVNVSGGSYVGGLLGVTYGGNSTVKDSFVVGATLSATGSYAGGLIGYIYEQSKITGSYVEDITVSTTGSYVGGFIGGINKSTVEKSYVMGVNATSKTSYAGGFAGVVYNYSDLTKCYVFDADVKATYYAGGHIGTIYGYSTVQISCAYGAVATTVGYIAGGFAGEATNATISNCYSQVNATSKTSGVGGFIAYAAGSTSVYNCYSAGIGMAGSKTNVGAFVGHSTLTFTGTNYYDSTLIDRVSALTGYQVNAYGGGSPKGAQSSYPQGKDTATMMQQATFVGWDFDTIWRIDENETYPYFWDWGWWIKTATVTFDKNADDAEGTMEAQVVEKGVDTALNTNQFTREDYALLGWSTEPSGEIVYENGAVVNLTEDITLYAVWGTPEHYVDLVSSPSDVYVGDTVTIEVTFGIRDTKYSAGMSNVAIVILLGEHVEYVDGSAYATIDGNPIDAEYVYDEVNNTVTAYVGYIAKGQECVFSVDSIALASAQWVRPEFIFDIEGTVTP